jgi:signal transduction histidine kinase
MQKESRVVNQQAHSSTYFSRRGAEDLPAKGEFVADVAHELRAPLTAQMAVGQNALVGCRSEIEYREAISSLLEESRHMADLIDGLRQLTATRNQLNKPTFKTIDLAALARSCIDVCEILAEEKSQHVKFTARASAFVHVDATLLRQALINLIHNAIEHCPPGSRIEVELEVKRSSASILIRDNGPGISALDQATVFERFRRGHSSDRRKKGLGLGLAIAKAIIESLSGRITLHSKLGVGTVFHIALPAAKPGQPRKKTLWHQAWQRVQFLLVNTLSSGPRLSAYGRATMVAFVTINGGNIALQQASAKLVQRSSERAAHANQGSANMILRHLH